MIDKLDSYGQFTYRGAWALEIVAATMGLLTGLTLGLQAYVDSDSAMPLDAILMAIPFIMVSFAELTKIPIATLLFVAPVIYKPIVLVVLTLLAGITFETVASGLETALAIRQEKYRSIENRINEVKSKIEALESTVTTQASDEALNKIDVQIEKLAERRTADTGSFQSRMDDLRNTSIPITTQTQLDFIGTQLDRIDATLNNKKVALDEAEIRDQDKFRNQQTSFKEQISEYLAANQNNQANKIQNKLDALPNPANRAQWKERRTSYDKEVKIIEKEKADFVLQRNEIFSNLTIDKTTQLELDGIKIKMEKSMSDISLLIANLYAQKEKYTNNQFTQLDQQSQDLREADILRQQIIQLESEKTNLANRNQIRRLASTLYGVSAVDVSDKQEKTTSKYYVGSLSGLAALAGPVTAIVALALQAIAARERQRIANSGKKTLQQKFWISLRRLLVRGKYQRKKIITKEVQIEVPIQVENLVEVEVPVIEKEFIYIPLLTDNPEKMLDDLKKRLPKEIFQKIKVALDNG